MPVTAHPVAVHLQAEPGFLFSVPSHQAVATAVRLPLSLLFPRLNQPIALHLPSYALCSIQPSQGPSTGLIPVCQCLPSSGSPNLGRAPGVVSPMLSIWEGSLSLAGAGLGVESALLHGSTPASWPGCVTPGSQGLFSRPAPSWLATFCHHR